MPDTNICATKPPDHSRSACSPARTLHPLRLRTNPPPFPPTTHHRSIPSRQAQAPDAHQWIQLSSIGRSPLASGERRKKNRAVELYTLSPPSSSSRPIPHPLSLIFFFSAVRSYSKQPSLDLKRRTQDKSKRPPYITSQPARFRRKSPGCPASHNNSKTDRTLRAVRIVSSTRRAARAKLRLKTRRYAHSRSALTRPV
ncbi:hypothetical protein K439DRAFT_72664 [Ramaria rubella]|nr:hypothetical protein K439DRAFT_72664 [Ramaria rubella]